MSSPGSGSSQGSCDSLPEVTSEEVLANFSNLMVLDRNGQVAELQTIIRNKETVRSDFVFYSDRLIRLVVEEGLNCLPSYKRTVETPTGCQYQGEWFEKLNCGVSVLRSGEAMEKGLRDCCRSIRIGKILIRRDAETRQPKIYYSKFPPQIEKRHILLLYPILDTGATAVTAIRVLKDHGVKENKIFLLTLFATPQGVHRVLTEHASIKVLTSEVHRLCPTYFGQKYFGSD